MPACYVLVYTGEEWLLQKYLQTCDGGAESELRVDVIFGMVMTVVGMVTVAVVMAASRACK